MKTDYVVRAKRFANYFVKFLDNHPFRKGDFWSVDFDYDALQEWCNHHSRKVKCCYGCNRVVFITSDYVLKLDYNCHCGNNCDELAVWAKACDDGYEYLFAPCTEYIIHGYSFLIMPRCSETGESDSKPWFYETLTGDEACYIDRMVDDIHSGNYGLLNGNWVLFDYACRSNDSYSSDSDSSCY